MSGETPDHLIDWKGNDWTPETRHARRAPERPLHDARRRSARRSPTSGRTRPACRSTPSCSAAPRDGVPLVREAFDWEHGVFLGATMASEKTAAAAGTVGELRFDPIAMLPFCGYTWPTTSSTG
jgi:phosphoenolpyruvate carboxykinase (GTP)